jgi:hypothetical protein
MRAAESLYGTCPEREHVKNSQQEHHARCHSQHKDSDLSGFSAALICRDRLAAGADRFFFFHCTCFLSDSAVRSVSLQDYCNESATLCHGPAGKIHDNITGH